jgi:hypothetical protein
MSRLTLLIFLALTFFLGACAPALKGSTSTQAINLDKEDAVITPGATWYVSSSLPANAFDIDLDRKWSLTSVSEGQKIRVGVGKKVEAFQVGLPEEWNFRLYTASGLQEIKDVRKTSRQINVEWYESIVLTFVADIPATAEAGTYRGLVTITANDELQVLPIKITIDGPVRPEVGSAA